MATTRQTGRATKVRVKDPAPVEAPADHPIPARPAPRPKDAPRTMKELRESRAGRRPSKARAPENVLREGLRLSRIPDPSIVVLFGATGDLAHRKVFPALYQLWRTDLLPHEFEILAVGRRDAEAAVLDLAHHAVPFGPHADADVLRFPGVLGGVVHEVQQGIDHRIRIEARHR